MNNSSCSSSSSTATTTTEEWALDMLAGFRFHPSEEEMVNLLKKKMEGKGSQASHFMPETDSETWDSSGDECISLFVGFLKKMMQGKHSQACHIFPDLEFCKYEPWDLPELLFPDSPYKAREWFSFTQPDYKYRDSNRCNRATKHGFWKITGKPRVIKQLSKSVTCKKRTLTFYEGRGSKSKKTRWVMHEYYFTTTELGSDPNPRTDFVLCRLKKKSANYKSDNKKLKDTSTCDELADPGTGGYMASNSEVDQAAANHMIPEAEKHLAYKELELVWPGSGNHSDDEPGGCVSFDFDDQVVDNMIQELFAQQGEYLDSGFPPPEPPERPHPPVSNIAYKIQSRATDESISEVPPFHQNQLKNYTLQSPILCSELGDLLHANYYIGCTESQSLHMEIATLFP